MQKKLIALAIAGLVSAPAFAQSNVTIYGIADAAVGFGSSDDSDFRGVVGGVLSGNRIGFKGSEDLGNGLKAVFQLEQGYNIDDGTFHQSTRQFSRQAWVGLQGSFGTVGLGRQYAPGYFAGYDAAMSSQVSPQSIFTAGAGLSITPNSPARWNNSVAYTGSFGAVTARAIYSANDGELTSRPGLGYEETPARDDKWGVSAEYANGPLKAGVFYHYLKDQASDDAKEVYVGAEYNFGVLALSGSWQNGRDIGAGDLDKRVWNLGVTVPVSAAGKVHATYGRITEDDQDDADANSWTLAYTHALSKRTTGYAAYNRVSNDDNASFQAGNGTVGLQGEDAGLFVVGMRHAF